MRLVPLFSGLPDKALQDLTRLSIPRSYGDGHILCNEGDPGEVLYILESGEIRVSRITAEGREIVIAMVEGPAALGELSLLDGAPRSATLTVQGSAKLRVI
ncbi:MAG: Crp/Fnr family transcriptional regulator, partial [Thermomicrobiales bacterium]